MCIFNLFALALLVLILLCTNGHFASFGAVMISISMSCLIVTVEGALLGEKSGFGSHTRGSNLGHSGGNLGSLASMLLEDGPTLTRCPGSCISSKDLKRDRGKAVKE